LRRQLPFDGIDANEFRTRIYDEKILLYIFMINKIIKSKITLSFYGQHISDIILVQHRLFCWVRKSRQYTL